MLVTDLRDYVELQGRISLQDLSRHFRIQESAVAQMMTLWVKKGKIMVVTPSQDSCSQGKCSDCFECDSSIYQVYVWKTPTQ